MQPKSVTYSIFLVMDLIRLSVIISVASAEVRDSLAWYTAIPLLCAAPTLWLMLALDESRFTLWLPLLTLIKALSFVSLVAFAVRAVPEAIRFGFSGGGAATALPAAGLFMIFDAAHGVYAFRRSRALCK